MKLITYTAIEAFIEDTFQLLLEKEAQNNLLIGNALAAKIGNLEDYFFITVKDMENVVRLTAIMKPPFNLVVYETNNQPCEEAVSLLAQELAKHTNKIPGIIGEEGLVKRLEAAYADLTGEDCVLSMRMNLLKLTKVIDLPRSSGYLRRASLKDMHFLPYWEDGFAKECNLREMSLEERVLNLKEKIAQNKVYIWQDKQPVCMVQHGRQLINGAALSCVYTPPHFRRNHYARTCTAEVTKELLAKGNAFCCLFADINNPISNKIYNEIGYAHLCVVDEVRFNPVKN